MKTKNTLYTITAITLLTMTAIGFVVCLGGEVPNDFKSTLLVKGLGILSLFCGGYGLEKLIKRYNNETSR